MPPRKLDIIDKYKIAGIAILIGTMVMLQFRRKDGAWCPISPPNEWFSIVTGCIVYTFMSITMIGQKMPKLNAFEHLKGWVWIAMLLYIGASYMVGLPVSRAVMAIAGSVQGFLYGSQASA